MSARSNQIGSPRRDSRLWKWKDYYDTVIGDIPWLRAVGPVFSIFGIFVLIVIQIPEDVFSQNSIDNFWPISILVFISMYLFLAAIYANDKLRTERQLRQIEEGFSYDKRGTLWNGGEPNIAFRIETFNGILQGLKTSIENSDLPPALRQAGRNAAGDFAKHFAAIYGSDIRSKKGGARWENLSLKQKLQEWTEYDSSTGWGILAAEIDNEEIIIDIVHFNGLYDDEGGRLFGHFIAGYCETVVSHIIENHDTGRFSDYDAMTIADGPVFGEGTVTLTLKPA